MLFRSVFDSGVLGTAIDILGAPVARLKFSVDQPIAQINLRLSDILPDGRVSRVSYQVFNLNHRDGHDVPAELVPGEIYEIAIKLNDCGHRFEKGHRIRLSIATGYWPMVWPSPANVSLSILTGESALDLPVRPLDQTSKPITFQAPAHGPLAAITQLDPGSVRRWTTQNHVTGDTTYVTEGIGGLFGEGVLRFDDIGTQLSHSLKRELTIRDDDPLSAKYTLTQTYKMGREGWWIEIATRTTMTSDASTFYIAGDLKATENGISVATRHWDEKIARDFL